MNPSRLKIISYFGNYGPANFWSNIKNNEITYDLHFIKEQGFNSILVCLPFHTFSNTCNSKFYDTFNHLYNETIKIGLSLVIRAGYLWESNFDEIKTFEKYCIMYKAYKNREINELKIEFANHIHFLHNNYPNVLHFILSWEDFYWPVKCVNELNMLNDTENEKETKLFMEYILERIGLIDKLYIEQRSNGEFNKIQYNNDITYAYYNTCNINSWDDKSLEKDFGKGPLLSPSMIIEKHFIEWYSRIKKILNLGERNILILSQFNLIDSTFEDDIYHKEEMNRKTKLACKNDNLDPVITFLAPIIKNNIDGIGFWSLWTVCSGHIYNGNFKFEFEGWESNAIITDNILILNTNQFISTNLGYIRLDNLRKWIILVEYSTETEAHLKIEFNGTMNIIKLNKNKREYLHIEYNFVDDKKLNLQCILGTIQIFRVDCYSLKHKSMFFDENRLPICESRRLKFFTE